MKLLGCLIIVFVVSLYACNTTKTTQQNNLSIERDSVEYELLITDTGFDTWLATRSKPMSFYSNEYYKSWNIRYVAEWNIRYTNGVNSALYENYVDYNSATDYGIELNYQLYNYFLFFEEKNNVVLIPRKGK